MINPIPTGQALDKKYQRKMTKTAGWSWSLENNFQTAGLIFNGLRESNKAQNILGGLFINDLTSLASAVAI